MASITQELPLLARITRTLYFSVPIGTNVALLAKGIASALSGPAHVFQIEGPEIMAEQGARIIEALFGGDTVVVWVDGRSELLVRFVEQWERYVESPASGSASVTRNLTIPARADLKSPGLLIGLHVRTDDDRHPDIGVEYPLKEDERNTLFMLGRASTLKVQTFGVGLPAGPLTMKDLCLLHARDATPGSRRPPLEILDDSGPITWTELEALLHLGRQDRWVFDRLNKAGRVDAEKYLLAFAAFELMDKRAQRGPHGLGTAVYASIYDVVWTHEWLDHSSYVFRGQREARWRQVTSLSRPNDGSGLDVQTLLDRIAETEAFLTASRQDQRSLLGTELDDDALLAVAQHYGFATPLMDYTTSLRVAAFFATYGVKPPVDGNDQIGVIYYFDRDRREIGGDGSKLTEEIGIGGFRLMSAIRLRIGDLHWIEPKLSSREDRISRQRGLFAYGFEPRDFQRLGIDRILFHQTGEVFEDHAAGISAEQLLPDDSKLAQLAARIRDEFRSAKRNKVHARLGGTLLPEDQVIGSDGIQLFAQLRESHAFFSCVAQSAPPQESAVLANILQEYFQLCRSWADAQFAGAGPPEAEDEAEGIDPFNFLIRRIASFGGTDVASIWCDFRSLHPDQFERQEQQEISLRRCSPPAELRGQLAYAAMYYALSWEHLRIVHGQSARALVQRARLLLEQSGEATQA